VGILATPVIERAKLLIYLVAATRTYDSSGNKQWAHTLWALNITTGATVHHPAVIAGSVPGDGDGSEGGVLAFSSFHHLQRPATTLDPVRRVLYVAFGAHGDDQPFHGWVRLLL
jgi:hypothetical protein